MNQIFIIAGCLLLIVIVAKIISIPFKIIKQVVINIVLGTLLVALINYLGAYFNYKIEYTNINALIVGILGVPGVVAIVVMKFLGI